MTLISRISRLSFIVLIPLAVVSGFLEWKKLPLSIIIGGVLGLLNLRVLSWGIGGMLGSSRSTGAMVVFSILRLLFLFLVMAILLYLGVITIMGLLIGFTVVFTVLLVEGIKEAKSL